MAGSPRTRVNMTSGPPRNRNTIEGFSREDINAVLNLKQLCISQVEAIYKPGNLAYGKFDILQCRVDQFYVAHAVVYPKDNIEDREFYYSWKCLLTGYSEDGVLAALEDLWNKIQGRVSEPVKRINDGQTLFCANGLYTIS